MAGLGVRMIAAVVAMAVVARLPMEATAITCNEVTANLLPCLNYIIYGGDVPSGCCSGLRNIVNAATTTDDRRTACNCQNLLAQRASGEQLDRATGLPDICGVSLPYRFSSSTDCSTIN